MLVVNSLVDIPSVGDLLFYSDTIPTPGLKYGDGIHSESELPYITNSLVSAWEKETDESTISDYFEE